jgi:hypothetical protein
MKTFGKSRALSRGGQRSGFSQKHAIKQTTSAVNSSI